MSNWPGDKNKSVSFDGLRRRADRLRSIFGRNDFAMGSFFVVGSQFSSLSLKAKSPDVPMYHGIFCVAQRTEN